MPAAAGTVVAGTAVGSREPLTPLNDWPPKSRNIREPSETLSCPSPRPTRPQVAAGADPRCMDTDLVGIYIEVEHKHYTGFFGNMTTITDSATAKIEPQEYAK